MRAIVWLVFAFAVAGCVRHDKVASIDTLIADLPAVATLSLDRSQVEANGTVKVIATLGDAVQSTSVGAITMRLSYDRNLLTFVPASSSVSVGDAAMHAADGTVTIAAARPQGFVSAALFSATFKLNDPSATSTTGTLRLSVDEISGTDFSNQLPPDASRLTIIAR